jgi:hypothetical protein
MRAPLVVVALGLTLQGLFGCATAAAVPRGELHKETYVRSPASAAEAQAYLGSAVAALRVNRPQRAVVFIDAILRCDHLTERGRANVYWLSAEAHRLAGNEQGFVDALGGFLVSAAVLEPRVSPRPVGTSAISDDEMRAREVEARAAILARKVKADPRLGKTRADAIRIEDTRDAPGIVAELACGASGRSRYVQQNVASHGEAFEERRLVCQSTGEQLVLWFDLTHTRPN